MGPVNQHLPSFPIRILIPESGKVLVNGMDTADEDLSEDIRRTVGVVFQNSG